jgi:hypothetical protein
MNGRRRFGQDSRRSNARPADYTPVLSRASIGQLGRCRNLQGRPANSAQPHSRGCPISTGHRPVAPASRSAHAYISAGIGERDGSSAACLLLVSHVYLLLSKQLRVEAHILEHSGHAGPEQGCRTAVRARIRKVLRREPSGSSVAVVSSSPRGRRCFPLAPSSRGEEIR